MNTVLRSVRKHWSEETINQARILRKEGLSYGDISKKLGVAKSTLHQWIYDLKRPGYITKKDNLEHLKRMRVLAISAIKRKRLLRLEDISQKVANDFNYQTLDNVNVMKALIAMMYWAEGSKGRGALQFANTDPKLSLLFLTLLRKCYSIDESKLRIRLHLHSYHDKVKTQTYWSELLNVPESKFGKIYIKPRSLTKKFRENFAGICFIRYHSDALRFEILENAKLIADKLAPVA